MRGDGVGVGDIDEVHGGTRSSGHPTGGDDGRGSRCGSMCLRAWSIEVHGGTERGATTQPGWAQARHR